MRLFEVEDELGRQSGGGGGRIARDGSKGRLGSDLDRAAPKVLFVTSEMTDFVKAGGLGDVSAFLPRALKQSADIRVVIPGYPAVLEGQRITIVGRVTAYADLPEAEIGLIDMPDGLVVYVVLCAELYDRDGSPYGDRDGCDWPDNDRRFARLARAAADIASGLAGTSWKPDLVHCNDWPSGLTPGYLAWAGNPIPSLLTIHNLAYQGIFDRDRLGALGIPQEAFQMDGVEFHGKLSFLKTGIFYASHVTTVSSTYAREITTPEFGCGLEGLLWTRAQEGRLTGIVNGIDASWEPRTDPDLVGHFCADDLSNRQKNADWARERFKLDVSSGPLFAIISRLVHQKGIDVIVDVADRIVEQGGQIAILGQGESELEQSVSALAERHQGSVSAYIGFEEADARRLYAGSDFLLMPSRFEPCGLSQMYAQRYGSLPIATRTGGLNDTVSDGTTGFLVPEASASGLADGIGRALDTYQADAKMAAMRKAAMSEVTDWSASARKYSDLYWKQTFSVDVET